MKILVLGAGVLGCNLAANLFRAGKNVTLLARGDWAENIKSNGLCIKNMLFPAAHTYGIPVITALKPDDIYDVIFVVVRYTHITSVIDTLWENKSENIIFVGNNVRVAETAALLPEKNVMFAFASSAGHRESDRVVSVDLHKITIGQIKGAQSGKRLVG